ncbi:hypothetical protein GCM10027057_21620 [Marisediminicola antarctica]|uniref:Uncharacterized protein n=1 Tax=Marisediminicola antarctica TaxID=674079 RepID=A0A7L5AFN5_9MICO|nr:hypothetical protein BHD05_03145 [Marisediminicola antarctica]
MGVPSGAWFQYTPEGYFVVRRSRRSGGFGGFGGLRGLRGFGGLRGLRGFGGLRGLRGDRDETKMPARDVRADTEPPDPQHPRAQRRTAGTARLRG